MCGIWMDWFASHLVERHTAHLRRALAQRAHLPAAPHPALMSKSVANRTLRVWHGVVREWSLNDGRACSPRYTGYNH